MNFVYSDRALSFETNIFSILNEKRIELERAGKRIYNLSVGTPDFAPQQHIMDAIKLAAEDPENYKYSLRDTDELIGAAQGWYKRRYAVELEKDEITAVYGSQEGISHIALVNCNPGDIVLAPDPCYPIFSIGPYLNGAEISYYRLNEDNDYLPNLSEIAPEIARKAKMMIVSFPANPVCVTAPPSFYEELVEFAKKYDILIVHDNAYSEIVYDGAYGGSFLATPGAREVGVEFNSLSKSYNMTGLRISFLLGNRDIIAKFKTIKSQIDYGISFIVQKAAVAALNGPQDVLDKNRAEYQKRRDALCGGLRSIGWDIKDSKGTMFAWAKLPEGYPDSNAFCLEMLEKTGVICTPGSSFGPSGEGHVRFALVLPVSQVNEAVRLIADSKMIAAH